MSPTILPTSLAAAQANVLAAATALVAALNASLIDHFTNVDFANWVLNWTNGKISDPATAPQPPRAYVVAYFTDPTNSTIQWAYATQGSAAVCAMPTIPGLTPHPTGLMMIGKETEAPGWFASLIGDQTPSGTTAPGTSLDGVTGIFQKVGSPVNAPGAFIGWFHLVSKLPA